MIGSRTKIAVSASVLIVLGLGLTAYKVLRIGFPLLPGEYREVWTIESKISLSATPGPVDVLLALPEGLGGWSLPEEHFASSGFEFQVLASGQRRTARWKRPGLERSSVLYYKLQAYRRDHKALPSMPVTAVDRPLLEADQRAAMERVVEELRLRTADPAAFTVALVEEFQSKRPGPDSGFLLSTHRDEPELLMLDVLAWAGIPAHRVRGIVLEDGRRRQTLSSLLEIHDGDRWRLFHPETGAEGLPPDFLVWRRGPGPVLEVAGGARSRLEFALVSNSLPVKTLLGMEEQAREFALLDFSIYSLPVEQQGVFKGLLLIPVAAVIVVLMRIFVGIRTSGTFMPILISLAFLQTTLLVGLAIFIALVGVGLWIRGLLSHMNLLLVARIAAVVVVVILLMAALAVLAYRQGLDQVLTVTFFPTVILAWTIERMSILWEEEGWHEVLIQGGGSLLVAVLAYLAMSNRLVAHLTFNFPELLLTLLGMILLLGKYTGYRLSELYRFRDIEKQA